RAVDIASGICSGLASAHAAGVIHRDLKPDNVLLAKDGRVVVTDFGIARAFIEAGGVLQNTMGVLMGTPAYLAPEQVEGKADVDAIGLPSAPPRRWIARRDARAERAHLDTR